ncbi:hypothetical protein F4604DRAFT_1681897 [Suillus subluteus]|nr:hypothetical protein F4604DRAFT_1681897 [Suillus subluteus]
MTIYMSGSTRPRTTWTCSFGERVHHPTGLALSAQRMESTDVMAVWDGSLLHAIPSYQSMDWGFFEDTSLTKIGLEITSMMKETILLKASGYLWSMTPGRYGGGYIRHPLPNDQILLQIKVNHFKRIPASDSRPIQRIDEGGQAVETAEAAQKGMCHNPAWLYSRSLVMDGNFKAEHMFPVNPTDEWH